jgi:hypothetical protein
MVGAWVLVLHCLCSPSVPRGCRLGLLGGAGGGAWPVRLLELLRPSQKKKAGHPSLCVVYRARQASNLRLPSLQHGPIHPASLPAVLGKHNPPTHAKPYTHRILCSHSCTREGSEPVITMAEPAAKPLEVSPAAGGGGAAASEPLAVEEVEALLMSSVAASAAAAGNEQQERHQDQVQQAVAPAADLLGRKAAATTVGESQALTQQEPTATLQPAHQQQEQLLQGSGCSRDPRLLLQDSRGEAPAHLSPAASPHASPSAVPAARPLLRWRLVPASPAAAAAGPGSAGPSTNSQLPHGGPATTCSVPAAAAHQEAGAAEVAAGVDSMPPLGESGPQHRQVATAGEGAEGGSQPSVSPQHQAPPGRQM